MKRVSPSRGPGPLICRTTSPGSLIIRSYAPTTLTVPSGEGFPSSAVRYPTTVSGKSRPTTTQRFRRTTAAGSSFTSVV